MAYSPEKIQALENALRKTAELVGKLTETPNQDGVKTGLDLTNESLICNHAADAVKEGVFKVVVMGGSMGTGKTSVINALSGSRILPDTVFPTTPIISYLRYGADDKKIYVYKNNKSVEGMSYEAFFNKFKFSNEDAEEARKTGLVKRFSDVEYSVVYSNVPLLKNGVQLLDVPSWLGEIVDASKTIRLAKDANAIIYMGNAISGGFNINDREFLKSNFEGRHSNNVFFLINKSDCLTEEELEEIKSYYKVQLTNLFTDENGDFNEDLYAKRVFFVSARNVLKKKTGEESYDDRDIPAFERFEKELEEFLTTDARSIATLNACFALMANAYNTIDCIAGNINSFNNEIICIEKKIQYVENVVDNLDNNLDIRKNQLLEIIDRFMAKLVDDIIGISYSEMKNIIFAAGQSISDIISTKWPEQYVINKERRTIEFEQKMEPVVQQIVKLLEHKVELVRVEFEQSIYPIDQELTDTIQETENLLNELGLQIHEARKKNKEEVLYNPVRLNPYNNIIYYITNPHSFHFDEIAWLILKEWVNSFEGKENTDESFNKSINEYLGISDIKSQLTGSILQNFEHVTDSIDGFMKTQKQLFECIKENSIIANDISHEDIQQNTTVLKEIWNCAKEAYQIVFDKDISLEEFRKIGNK